MMMTGAACWWLLVGVRRQSDHVGGSATALPFPWPEGRAVPWCMEAPVIMVGSDSVEVERRLSAGELVCPCGGDSGPVGICPVEDRPRGRAAAATPGPLRRLSGDACAVERGVPVATGRRGRGDRCRIAVEGRWGRASTDRIPVGPAGVHGPGLAARVRPEGGDGALGVHPRCWPARSTAGSAPSDSVLARRRGRGDRRGRAAARRRLGVVGAVSPWQLASAVTDGRLLAAGRTMAVANTN